MEYDVFISYSRLDSDIADKITCAFDNAGISYFIDREEICGSEAFQKIIAKGILESRIFLFLASQNSYNSIYTNKEVAFAIKKKGKSILPYIIDNSELPSDLDLSFADINWRTSSKHSIDIITNDILKLLNRQPLPSHQKDQVEEWFEKGKFEEENGNKIGAAKWYRMAAERGHCEAQLLLAFLYDEDDGEISDKKEALKWYLKAAEQGDTDAQFILGGKFQFGLAGVDENINEALKWYLMAAQQGDVDAQAHVGDILYLEGDEFFNSKEAAKWYRKAAEQGNTESQFWLASMYELGDGVNKDTIEAIKWYKLAAEQGDADAQFRLGEIYHNGEGVAVNIIESIKWYGMSANNGYLKAQFALGIIFKNGDGIIQDYVKAEKWLRMAAEQNHIEAQYYLGTFYQFGKGVKKNLKEAKKWYSKASQAGHKLASSALKEMRS